MKHHSASLSVCLPDTLACRRSSPKYFAEGLADEYRRIFDAVRALFAGKQSDRDKMIALLRSLFDRSAGTLRAIAGVPDYDRYLAHMRSAHPGDRVMTETEFNLTRMNARYNSVGSRCC